MPRSKNKPVRRKERAKIKETCPECGQPGLHYISMEGQVGFYTCAKFYGADGKRLPEHVDREPGLGAFLMGLMR